MTDKNSSLLSNKNHSSDAEDDIQTWKEFKNNSRRSGSIITNASGSSDSFEQMNEKIAAYDKLYFVWRGYDIWTCILVIAGLALAIVQYEVDSFPGNLKEMRWNPIRLIVSILTLIALVTLTLGHIKKRQW